MTPGQQIFTDHTNVWSVPGIETDTSSAAVVFAVTAPWQSMINILKPD